MPARTVGPLLVAVLLAFIAACGVRTDPRPPEATAARPPDGFRAQAAERGVELRWERPTKTMDGERLYDLAAFAIERRSIDGAFETIAKIPVTDTDRLRTQRVFRFVDEDAPPGTLEYQVRALTADGQHGVATDARTVTLPAAPRGAAPDARPAEPARTK